MEKRITCKVHEDNEVIIKVGVEGIIYPMIAVWNDIKNNKFEFYTLENNKKAKVYARERNGTKYITSHADGITPNNLDELLRCG